MSDMAKADSLVSIIVPNYNSEQYIAECLNSIISQTYTEWEIVIVDDCSNDDSPNIARSYVEQDERIKLIALNNNAGSAVARNTGIEASSGRFIAFLDSDDVWLPDKLAKQIEFMRSNKHPFTHTYYQKMTETGELTEKYVKPPHDLTHSELLKSNQIGCLTVMYDTAQVGKVYMPLIRKRQDYGTWLNITKQGIVAKCLPEVLARYRVRSGSISSNKLEMVKCHWDLFRNVENFSIPKAAYYVGWNIYRKIIS